MMDELTHGSVTSEKWKVLKLKQYGTNPNQHGYILGVATEDDFITIESFGAGRSEEHNELLPYYEDMANLISAAPEMYEMLSRIVAMQEKYHGNATDTHIYLDDLVVDARKILRKARGE